MNFMNFLKPCLRFKLRKNICQTSNRNFRRIRNRSNNDYEYLKLEGKLKSYYESQYKKTSVNTAPSFSEPKVNSVTPHFAPVTAEIKNQSIDPVSVTPSNQYEMLNEKVAPLHTLPYVKQLKKKHRKCVKALWKFSSALQEHNGQIATDIETPCVLDLTIPSPVTEHYRNKDEFSIRDGVDGDPKTVGFFLSSPADERKVICVGPDELPIVRGSHKLFAYLFQNYIKFSLLPACHNFSDGGYWRNLVVRSNTQGDVMGIVIMHPQNLTEEQLNEEKEKLKSQFINSPRLGLKLTSFYFQACRNTRCSHAESPFQLLFGEPYIFEEMNGIKFRISPDSFFQTNTAAAEQLYKVIFNAAKATKATTVLDICCGIGPVSFMFAPHVKRCIGIDYSAEAIEDAKANSKLNGFDNVEFHAGKCEDVLTEIINDNFSEELIAVVNPARGSLGKNVFRVLRECKHLKKVVYVCCKPEGAVDNYIWLCEPTKKKHNLGAPFYPMRAVPIDLFPQTDHCELVILFQRIHNK